MDFKTGLSNVYGCAASGVSALGHGVSFAAKTTANCAISGVSALGHGACFTAKTIVNCTSSVVRYTGHVSSRTTAAVADVIGCTILAGGSTAACVFGYDAYQWSQGIHPIWANWSQDTCKRPMPLLFLGKRVTELKVDAANPSAIEEAISMTALASIALVPLTFIGTYVSFKISELANEADKRYFS